DNAVAPAVRPRRLALAAAAFVPLLALGVVSATDTQDLLDMRWAGGDRLVELGYHPDQIDAGFDWLGYHYAGSARPDRVSLNPPHYPPPPPDPLFSPLPRGALRSPLRTPPPPGLPPRSADGP